MFSRLIHLPVNAAIITGAPDRARCRALVELGSWAVVFSVLLAVSFYLVSGVLTGWYLGTARFPPMSSAATRHLAPVILPGSGPESPRFDSSSPRFLPAANGAHFGWQALTYTEHELPRSTAAHGETDADTQGASTPETEGPRASPPAPGPVIRQEVGPDGSILYTNQ